MNALNEEEARVIAQQMDMQGVLDILDRESCMKNPFTSAKRVLFWIMIYNAVLVVTLLVTGSGTLAGVALVVGVLGFTLYREIAVLETMWQANHDVLMLLRASSLWSVGAVNTIYGKMIAAEAEGAAFVADSSDGEDDDDMGPILH